jgi:two-component system chemotaxis response regulator CheY
MDTPGSVLLVDDDEALIRVIAELLRSKGFGVWTADNGVRGYTAYLHHPTEFVITDIQMPELNGIEMIRCIRGINSAVKAIYMSGGPDRFSDEIEVEEREFSAMLLAKPFSSGDLLKLMTAATTSLQMKYRSL